MNEHTTTTLIKSGAELRWLNFRITEQATVRDYRKVDLLRLGGPDPYPDADDDEIVMSVVTDKRFILDGISVNQVEAGGIVECNGIKFFATETTLKINGSRTQTHVKGISYEEIRAPSDNAAPSEAGR